MKILIDMNLSPLWVEALRQGGHDAVHWSQVGDPREQDRVLMAWAIAHDHLVFTNDLDFGALLAATGRNSPSVLQVRTSDLLPATIAPMVLAAIAQFSDVLAAGALVTIDRNRSRVRVLPLGDRQ